MCENQCGHGATTVNLPRGEAIVIRTAGGSVRVDGGGIYVTAALPVIFECSPCEGGCSGNAIHSPGKEGWRDLHVAEDVESQEEDDWRAPVSGFDAQPGYAHFVDFESNSASGEGEIPSS